MQNKRERGVLYMRRNHTPFNGKQFILNKNTGEIGSHFDMTGATISYHLGILKKADLICETKYKNYVYYELNISAVEDIMLWLADLKGEV